MEFEISEIKQHVDASHHQACSDFERASELITKAWQNEVQRNSALCMLIQRLEEKAERAFENVGSLSALEEANRQLKLQVDELQKQLRDKHNSLAEANQTIALMKHDRGILRQEMQRRLKGKDISLTQANQSISLLEHDGRSLRHQLKQSQWNSHSTNQEVTEGRQDGKSMSNVVKNEGGQRENVDTGIKKEDHYAVPAAAADDDGAADEYQCTQSDETAAPTDLATSTSADIKAELLQNEEDGPLQNVFTAIKEEEDYLAADDDDDNAASDPSADIKAEPAQEEDVQSDMAPEVSSDRAPVVSSWMSQSHPPSLTKSLRLSVQLVDCCATQAWKRTQDCKTEKDEEKNKTATHQPWKRTQDCKTEKDEEKPKTEIDDGSQPSSSAALPETTTTKHLKCSICDKSFNNKRNLRAHERLHQGSPYQCPLCAKTFSRKEGLNKHQLVHTGDKPFCCILCGRGFAHEWNLKQHKITHTGDRPYRCGQCGNTFSQASSLRAHKRTHTGEKPYHCLQCGKRFSRGGNLKVHQLTHSGDKRHQCGQCGKSFAIAGNLKQHMLSHTGVKRHQCGQCGKSFSIAGNLRTHLLIHSGERPHQCDQCGLRFYTATHLKRHQAGACKTTERFCQAQDKSI